MINGESSPSPARELAEVRRMMHSPLDRMMRSVFFAERRMAHPHEDRLRESAAQLVLVGQVVKIPR
jgi:hypothetical protein